MPTAVAAPADEPEDENAASPRQRDQNTEIWMERIARGDNQAFGCLVRAYQHRLQAFAARLLGGDTEKARDIAQEVFLRVWQSRGTYIDKGCVLPYLLRITVNLCHDARRQARRHPPPAEVAYLDAAPDEREAFSPESRLRGMAFADAVRRALDLLPDEQRDVFILSHFEQRSYREIAEILGCPVGTVGSRKHLAVESLRRLLKDWTED